MTEITYRAHATIHDREKPGYDAETNTYDETAAGRDVSASGIYAVQSRGKFHVVRHVGTGLTVPIAAPRPEGSGWVGVPWARYERHAWTLPNVTAARGYMAALDAAGILTLDNGKDTETLRELRDWILTQAVTA